MNAPSSPGEGLQRAARALADIAHALESQQQTEERLRRVLVLMQQLVASARCGVVVEQKGQPRLLVVHPVLHLEGAPLLERSLEDALRAWTHLEERAAGPASELGLSMPLLVLDEVVGVLRVEAHQGHVYEPQDVGLLSVVAAQLGAFLTTRHFLAEERRHTERLQAAHDFQQLLVGVVSHDLRGPLQVIRMGCDMLLMQPRPEREHHSVSRMLSNSKRAERIINDLLDVTATRATGLMKVAVQPANLHALVTEVLAEFSVTQPGRAIEVSSEGGPGNYQGEWDPDRLKQVVTNLLNNALQHGGPGAPVRIRLASHADRVEVQVQNQGTPIHPELLASLFEPFKQGQARARRAGSGLGLGLYIVDQLVRAHGGEVAASSDATWTTFAVKLPRARPAPRPG